MLIATNNKYGIYEADFSGSDQPMVKGTVDYLLIIFRITIKLAKIFNPLLQKGLSDTKNREVSTVTYTKTSTLATKISTSMSNEPSRSFKSVSIVGVKLNN